MCDDYFGSFRNVKVGSSKSGRGFPYANWKSLIEGQFRSIDGFWQI